MVKDKGQSEKLCLALSNIRNYDVILTEFNFLGKNFQAVYDCYAGSTRSQQSNKDL